MSEYNTDIINVTCSCPDFKFRRSRLGKNDTNRRCKHLQEKMEHIPIVPSTNRWSEKKRHPRERVEKIAQSISLLLKSNMAVEKFIFCGSYRRNKETIGDLDVVIVTKNSLYRNEILERIKRLSQKVMVSGPQKTSMLINDVQVDIRFVEPQHYVFQVAHATGSTSENIRLRSIAKRMGLTLNEYGLYKNGIPIKDITSENDLYKCLGIPYVSPENR